MFWLKRYVFFVVVSSVSLFLLGWYFSTSQGGYDYSQHVLGRDFVNTYSGGLMISEGRWHLFYDGAAYWDEIKRLYGNHYPIHNWSYPPLLWPVSQFLSLFPYFVAYALWTAAGIAMVFWAVRMLGLRWYWGVFICLSPAGFWNVIAGQNGYFISSLLMIALVLTHARKPVTAGLSWAILAVKPHLGVCVLPMLLCQYRFKTIAWGAFFLTAAILATIFVYGLQPWELFLTYTSKQQVYVIENWGGALGWMVPSGFMQGRLWGFDTSSAYWLHMVFAILAIALLVYSWPGKEGQTWHWALWLVSGTLVILPYSFLYDLMMLQFALALWYEAKGRIFSERLKFWEPLLLGVAWLTPILSAWIIAFYGIQLLPFVLLLILFQMGRAKRKKLISFGTQQVFSSAN